MALPQRPLSVLSIDSITRFSERPRSVSIWDDDARDIQRRVSQFRRSQYRQSQYRQSQYLGSQRVSNLWNINDESKENLHGVTALPEPEPPAEQPASPAPQYPSGARLAAILASLMLGTLLFALDTSILSVAIPEISTEFRALEHIGWYGSTYLLVATATQPLFGNVYRYFGARNVYLASIVVFEGGSALCAAAPSSAVLILGRSVAAFGAGGMIQGALSIVTLISPLEKRPQNLAIVASMLGISVPLGPIVGGLLTDGPGWRWCFWINLPAGAVAFVLVISFLTIPVQSGKNRDITFWAKMRHFDWLGSALLLAATVCLFLALQWGGKEHAWDSSTVVGLLVGSALIVAVFGGVQWKLGEDATLPLRILRVRSIYMGAAFVFFTFMASYTWEYYFPMFFQVVQGESPIRSGVRTLPLAVAVILGAGLSGGLASKTGHYVPFMVGGQALAVIGSGFFTHLDVDAAVARLAGLMVVTGFGYGMVMQLPYTAVQAALVEDDIYVGNAVITLFTQLGGAISLACAESIFSNGLLRIIPTYTAAIAPQEIVHGGALDLSKLDAPPDVIQALRHSYADAISTVFIFSLAAIGVSVLCACGMEWLNVKKVAKAREEAQAEASDSPISSSRHSQSTDSSSVSEKQKAWDDWRLPPR